MKASDLIVKEIIKVSGTTKFFGYIGGMVAHLVDSIYRSDECELVNCITEQGAGFAADGYARSTNKLGVVFVTSGPGATNVITPIADCFFDSVPVLFITGQVNSYEYNRLSIRQNGFQETDIVSIVRPITKFAKTLLNKETLVQEIRNAIKIALTGRKGPVLLDIPMDLQRAEIDLRAITHFDNLDIKQETTSTSKLVQFFKSALKYSKRPLVLVGNGCRNDDTRKALQYFFDKTSIPCVETIHGIDTVEPSYEYNLGFIGKYGERFSNLAFYNSDLLIVLGSRLDICQTGAKTEFLNSKVILQIDIDDSEIINSKFGNFVFKQDIGNFLSSFNESINDEIKLDIAEWLSYCATIKSRFNYKNKQFSLPNEVVSQILQYSDKNSVVTFDVGQNQIWVAQSLLYRKSGLAMTSGGLGSMGFSLPAAIGASFTADTVFAFCGDGGFQMNIQELEVIKRRNLNIKIIVLNNNSLGMVKSFQKLYFDGRYASTFEDYSCPNISNIGNAYGIRSVSIKSLDFNIDDISSYLEDHDPCLIEIVFEPSSTTEPRLTFGNDLSHQEPKLKNDQEINFKVNNINLLEQTECEYNDIFK